jgi:hypothetical protein
MTRGSTSNLKVFTLSSILHPSSFVLLRSRYLRDANQLAHFQTRLSRVNIIVTPYFATQFPQGTDLMLFVPIHPLNLCRTPAVLTRRKSINEDHCLTLIDDDASPSVIAERLDLSSDSK